MAVGMPTYCSTMPVRPDRVSVLNPLPPPSPPTSHCTPCARTCAACQGALPRHPQLPTTFPISSAFLLCLCSRDLFQQWNLTVPTTWQELADLAVRMNGTGGHSCLFLQCFTY